MFRIIFSPASEKDIENCYRYIARENRNAAERFFESMQGVSKTLSKMPHIGEPFATAMMVPLEIRYLPIPGFPKFLFFYGTNEKIVRVLRVLHSARDMDETFLFQ